MTRKLRNYALLVGMIGFFGIAADGCPACNFTAPGYELFTLVVQYNNKSAENIYISGPGETMPFVPLIAAGKSRTRNLGERFEGEILTFEVYNEAQQLKATVKCEVKPDIHAAPNFAQARGLQDGAFSIVCGGGSLQQTLF